MIMMTVMKKKTTVKKPLYFTPTRRIVMKKNEEEVEYITRVFRCLYDFDLMGVWNSLSTTEYRELAKEILDKEITNTMFYSEV